MIEWTYRATLLRWIDADTADLRIDLGFRVFSEQRVRLAGLDAPEMRARDASERERAVAATQRAMELLPVGSTCLARTEKNPLNKFWRWLAVLILPDGRDLNATLLAEGLAQPYDGGKRGMTKPPPT